MAKNTIAYYTKDGNFLTTNVTTGSAQDIFIPGVNGSKVLMITSLGASANNLQLSLNDGTTSYDLYNVVAPTLNLDILDATKLPKGPNGLRYINIPAGWTLQAQMSSGTSVPVAVYGEDY